MPAPGAHTRDHDDRQRVGSYGLSRLWDDLLDDRIQIRSVLHAVRRVPSEDGRVRVRPETLPSHRVGFLKQPPK